MKFRISKIGKKCYHVDMGKDITLIPSKRVKGNIGDKYSYYYICSVYNSKGTLIHSKLRYSEKNVFLLKQNEISTITTQ